MKNLYVAGFLAVLLSASVTARTQQPVPLQQTPGKPLQFSHLPEKFECSFPALEKIASSRMEENITMQFGKFVFAGQVVERVQRSNNVVSINIRSSNFPGALFNISITTAADHTQTMSGRIVNPRSGDVLELLQENDRYFLQKKPTKFFMTE